MRPQLLSEYSGWHKFKFFEDVWCITLPRCCVCVCVCVVKWMNVFICLTYCLFCFFFFEPHNSTKNIVDISYVVQEVKRTNSNA